GSPSRRARRSPSVVASGAARLLIFGHFTARLAAIVAFAPFHRSARASLSPRTAGNSGAARLLIFGHFTARLAAIVAFAPFHRSARASLSPRTAGNSGAARLLIFGHFTARLAAIVPAATPALLGCLFSVISPLASQRSCLRQLRRCSARTSTTHRCRSPGRSDSRACSRRSCPRGRRSSGTIRSCWGSFATRRRRSGTR